jgi:hypothetical protein
VSSDNAIAAVTRVLEAMIGAAVGVNNVACRALDKATDAPSNAEDNWLNLFLYQVTVNGAWRNLDPPDRPRPGKEHKPMLPLDLYYLLTTCGNPGAAQKDHVLLGKAMLVLHENPVPDRKVFETVSEVGKQFERIRITPVPLSIDEMSKLWSGFQTNYRLSVAYQVSVVLIDPVKQAATPLPVLRRGSEDQGPSAGGSSFPAIDKFRFPNEQQAARVGEAIVIEGHNLTRGGLKARFYAPFLQVPIDVIPQPGDRPGELTMTIPPVDAQHPWRAGLYTLALVAESSIKDAGGSNRVLQVSNESALGLAPVATRSPKSGPAGTVIEVKCQPQISFGQRVTLIFGVQQLALVSAIPAGGTDSVSFKVPDGSPAGDYVLRLSIDGVESIPVVRTGDPALPSFDPEQTFTVTI